MAFEGVRNGAGFLGNHNDHCVGYLAQPDGGAMPGAERLIQILALSERENAGSVGDAVTFENNSAVVNGIIWKENGFQHLGRGLAINENAGFDGFEQIDGLLDGDEGTDADIGKALDGLDDYLNVLALLMCGGEERQIAQFGQHAAQFGLENHQDGESKKRGKSAQQVLQHFEVQ